MIRHIPIALAVLFGLSVSLRAGAQGWQWAKANTNGSVDAWSVATDKAGNVFVGGFKSGDKTAIFDGVTLPAPGIFSMDYQCVIAKYDNNGHFLWARGTEDGNSCLIGITADQAGNSYMFGYFSSPTIKIGQFTLTNAYHLDVQYFLARFDPSGNVMWALSAGNTQKYFITAGNIAFTLGPGAICSDAAGNVYITANFHMPNITIGAFTLTNTDPLGNTDDIFIAKYDASGNALWARSAGGIKSDDAYAITTTPAGDIYIAGDFASPLLPFGPSVISNTSTGQVAFIARYNAAGMPVWANASGGAGNEYAAGIASDVANNVYLIGGVKDNSITFSGTTITNPNPGLPVLYLAKFDPSNAISWYKSIASPTGGDAYGYAVATSFCGDVWVCGGMSISKTDTSVPNPGVIDIEGNLLTAPANSYDPIFIAGYTSSGSYIGASVLQSGNDDQSGIACDGAGNVFLCSDYVGRSPFSVGSHSFPMDTTIDEMLYIAKYTPRSPYSIKRLDTMLCYTSGLILNAPAGYQNYLWSTGLTGVTELGIKDTGTYWVWGYDSCASQSIDTFKVTSVCDCRKYFFIPNSFTPNGDGQNDVFYPRSGLGQTHISSFRIYNRWGALMFERENIMANDVANAWDGTFQGSTPLPDVYVYIIEAVCENGAVINRKGSVTIIR